MKLEDQVAPLALSQRMKELGFPQLTAFAWAQFLDDAQRWENVWGFQYGVWGLSGHEEKLGLMADDQKPEDVKYTGELLSCIIDGDAPSLDNWDKHVVGYMAGGVVCAAPTVAEMGEWLPDRSPVSGSSSARQPPVILNVLHGVTEAEARARLLIALAEAGPPYFDLRSIAGPSKGGSHG